MVESLQKELRGCRIGVGLRWVDAVSIQTGSIENTTISAEWQLQCITKIAQLV
jgi:hypothetical protein